MSKKFATLGELIKKDLDKGYILPSFSSSYGANYRFFNNHKYQLYDYPPSSQTFIDIVFPQSIFCTAGGEIPVLTDHPPPDFLKKHWKTWLPVFPLAKFINIDEGLKDDNIPIVTCNAIQDIPRHKHSVDPDVLFKLQLKSSIPDIGVPCPRYMHENNLEFPCVVKVDLSYFGHGTFISKNKNDLLALVKGIREERGWRGKIVYQELIERVQQVQSYIFYLRKTGEVIWIGTNTSLFHNDVDWFSLTCDWNKQEEEKDRVYDDFVIPISEYLHKNGFFGMANFELLVNDRGRYLVDLNPRLPGEAMHLLMAPFMASQGFTYSILEPIAPTRKTSARILVEDANKLNQTQDGRVVVASAVDVGKDECENWISFFGKTREDCQILIEKIKDLS